MGSTIGYIRYGYVLDPLGATSDKQFVLLGRRRRTSLLGGRRPCACCYGTCAVARDRTFAESSSTDRPQSDQATCFSSCCKQQPGSKEEEKKKWSNWTAFRSGRRQVKNALALILLGCSRRSCNHDSFASEGSRPEQHGGCNISRVRPLEKQKNGGEENSSITACSSSFRCYSVVSSLRPAPAETTDPLRNTAPSNERSPRAAA